MRRLPIGVADYRKLREGDHLYVDKTAFVADVLRAGAEVLLFTRPRRFGKTLNLSTLRYYVERSDDDLSPLFRDLAVWGAGADVRGHFRRHPVIFLTFKDVKAQSFADCLEGLQLVLRREFDRHAPALAGSASYDHCERLRSGRASRVEYEDALRFLSEQLARAYGEQVVIIVDEYDTPIHAGRDRGYDDDAVAFFRNLFSAGLKDNPHLHKGVLSGILRVAKESVFSGLNNLVVHALTSRAFSTAFGFTPGEVERLAKERNLAEHLPELAHWYDGYRFGEQVIYNPWSVLNHLEHPENGFQPYWVATASDALLGELLIDRGYAVRDALEAVLRGDSIERSVADNIALGEVAADPESLWSILLHLGYLKGEAVDDAPGGGARYRLSVPNREVHQSYRKLFRRWLAHGLGRDGDVARLVDALLGGDAATVERLLTDLLLSLASFHDTARRPEVFYHGFLLGLLAVMHPRYEVASNREAGYGRLDILVTPRDGAGAGAIVELKALASEPAERPQDELDAALRQIDEQRYAAGLLARGVAPVHRLAAVFHGKRVWVASATAAAQSGR